ncbi:MAG: methyltransferase domain-containing protein [Ferruginibacter sp.]
MINLRIRSCEKELLDREGIPFADIRQNMKELNTINSYLGGHRISIGGIKKILQACHRGQPVTICEIGCGGGDNLKAIERWCIRNSMEVSFIGIDKKPECIEFARQQYPALRAIWIESDYNTVRFDANKPDIIFSSLFCHHFVKEDIVKMLQWMRAAATMGFFINDLHRHPLAYYPIKIITGFFSRSYLVRNDAPLSVARGFKKKEWQKMIAEAGISNYSIKWKWAFRHLIICTNY